MLHVHLLDKIVESGLRAPIGVKSVRHAVGDLASLRGDGDEFGAGRTGRGGVRGEEEGRQRLKQD